MLCEVSPARAWRMLAQPSMVRVRMTAPSELAPLDAAMALFPQTQREEAAAYRREHVGNHRFFDEYDRQLVAGRQRRATWVGWHELLYLVVRIARPEVVVETGVFDGQSSAVILQALCDNDRGLLVAVDLPALETIYGSTHEMRESTLPSSRQPGWAVPSFLCDRYRLSLGDSAELLPKLLDEYPSVDIFFHDSLHTREHMYFEYSTVWPRLSDGGVLLSDDIWWNSAFHTFCRERAQRYVVVAGLGATRKPAGTLRGLR